MPKQYKECEECRTRNSARAARCGACGGRLKSPRHAALAQNRARAYALVASAAVLATLIGIVLRRLT